MQFQVESTDGPAQTGLLTINKLQIKTPTILFPPQEQYQPCFSTKTILTECVSQQEKNNTNSLFQIGPSVFSQQNISSEKSCINKHIIIPEALPNEVQEYLLQYGQQQHKIITILPGKEELIDHYTNKSPSYLCIVSNALHLFSHPQTFVSYMTTLRKKINYDAQVFLPRIATPSTLALLCYAGADLFDATSAIIASRHHQFFLPDTTTTTVSEIEDEENPCLCPICSQTQHHPSSFSFKQLLNHNYYLLYQELLSVRHAIRHHRLRDLVEKRIRNAPLLVNILRYLDTNKDDHLEQRTPVCMPPSYILQATSREAGFRPEIKRFQHRVLSRYQKPKDKSILLLLPCSAKKPYSFSKSHQRFQKAVSNVPNKSMIHEVIITSPLGLVPRELELTYPASSYDISVTGTWYEDEKHMIQHQLNQYLHKNKYDAIVSHLPKDLIYPPEQYESNWQYSLTDQKATSRISLNQLTSILQNISSEIQTRYHSKRDQRLTQFNAIASYQFGPGLGQALTKDCIVKGKYPYLKLFDTTGQQLGMIPDNRGLISLTAEGGKRMIHFNEYTVKIDTGFTVKGSILSPGVNSADERIRKGDDVLIIQGEEYLGVGQATMNGMEMTQRSYGEAVNMRHKIKK